MKYGIKQTYIDQIHAVLATYPAVEKVLLYGSRAKGTHSKWSDIYERAIHPSQQLQ